MRYSENKDIIDKVFDRIVKGPEYQDVTMSDILTVASERTYIGLKAIADRLGCSQYTVKQLLDNETLLWYPIYKHSRSGWTRRTATNETLVRLTFLAWCSVAERKSRASAPVPYTRS